MPSFPIPRVSTPDYTFRLFVALIRKTGESNIKRKILYINPDFLLANWKPPDFNLL